MTADQIEEHRARCQPHLVRLRMLAQGEAGAVLSRRVIVEIAQATGAIVAEAEAAGHELEAAGHEGGAAGHEGGAAGHGGQAADQDGPGGNGPGHPAAGTFLRVRLNRLAAAAEAAIAAARAANSADMRCQLRRFDTLTAAIWTVLHAVYDPHTRRPARPGVV